MTNPNAHPIAMLPDSARMLHATANVAATAEGHPWFQLGLKLDLYKSDTPLPGMDVRILRISTVGTMINNQLYRSKDGSGHPIALSTTKMIEALATKEIAIEEEEKTIFDQLFLKIENYHPDHDNAGKGHILNPKHWVLSDYSPKTKNNETSLSTSTSIGFDVGTFGGTPTAGLNYSESQSRQWTISEYDLLGIASVDPQSPSAITWNVARTENEKDPEIARSTFAPDLEAVFRSSQNSVGKRYSVISALAIPIYVKEKITTKIKAPSIWGLGKSIFNFIKKQKPEVIETEKDEKFSYEKDDLHIFSVTLLIDWHAGCVETLSADSLNGRAGLNYSNWTKIGGEISSNESAPAETLLGAIMPNMSDRINSPELFYPTFEGDSPVITIPSKAGRTSVEVVIPSDRLFCYYGGCLVKQEVLSKNNYPSAMWGSFSNTLLIRNIDPSQPVRITPTGYDGEIEEDSADSHPEESGGDDRRKDVDAQNERKIDIKTSRCAMFHIGERLESDQLSNILDISSCPIGSGLISPMNDAVFSSSFYLKSTINKFDPLMRKISESESAQKMEGVDSFAFLRSKYEKIGVGICNNSLLYSNDGFEDHKLTSEVDDVIVLNDHECSVANMFNEIEAHNGNGSVVLSLDAEEILQSGLLRSDDMEYLSRSIIETSQFCVIGKIGISFISVGSMRNIESESGKDVFRKFKFRSLLYSGGGSGDVPAAVKQLVEIRNALADEGASRVIGSFVKLGESNPDEDAIGYYAV